MRMTYDKDGMELTTLFGKFGVFVDCDVKFDQTKMGCGDYAFLNFTSDYRKCEASCRADTAILKAE
jgi:hypothetical protein